ncbi:MAG TPA: substrate-binding domain-containing protein [Phototrophicaceae bacterium]|nr:substrate-binding domain-containing protein [Phototrophicaceae bacterium]
MPTIGVVISGIISHDYLGEVFRGVADTAKQHRYTLITSIQNLTRQDDLTHLFGRGGCDGAVMVIPHNYEHMVEVCRRSGRDCVLIDYPRPQEVDDLPTVGVTNRAAIQGVVRHLVGLGHRRIGMITGGMVHSAGLQRLLGYQDGLAEAGIPFDPELTAGGEWSQPVVYAAAKELLQLSPRPSAIVASSDLGAFAVYRAARERGLEISRDLSVTGFDDNRLASAVAPPLTTVRQPTYELGKTAVEMLIARLEGQPLPELHVRLNTELIIRQSTGPATTP